MTKVEVGDDLGRVVPLRGLARRDRADQVVEDMFDAWRHQQLARNLALDTIDARVRLVTRFLEHCNEMPWAWTPAHVDEFFGDLRGEHRLARSTIRAYQNALKLFCDYLVDPRYRWDTVCEVAFGTHPVQVVHEWNTAGHHQDNEQDPKKRAFTREELQVFFDRADDEVDRIRSLGRKGWLPAFRDAVQFKTAYGWGLRRNEVRHLQTVDFSRNPHAKEFGRYGALEVRHGKAHTGSTPKRRTVLTVRGWSAQIVEHWIQHALPLFSGAGEPARLDLFPTERGTLVSEARSGPGSAATATSSASPLAWICTRSGAATPPTCSRTGSMRCSFSTSSATSTPPPPRSTPTSPPTTAPAPCATPSTRCWPKRLAPIAPPKAGPIAPPIARPDPGPGMVVDDEARRRLPLAPR